MTPLELGILVAIGIRKVLGQPTLGATARFVSNLILGCSAIDRTHAKLGASHLAHFQN